jgi:hypothetical protein
VSSVGGVQEPQPFLWDFRNVPIWVERVAGVSVVARARHLGAAWEHRAYGSFPERSASSTRRPAGRSSSHRVTGDAGFLGWR